MKRWSWYEQVRDALFALLAIGLLIFEAIFRDNADDTIVIAALICSGIAGSGLAARWLIGRWIEKDSKLE